MTKSQLNHDSKGKNNPYSNIYTQYKKKKKKIIATSEKNIHQSTRLLSIIVMKPEY